MVFLQRLFCLLIIYMSHMSYSLPLSQRLAHLCKGAAVHVLNQKNPHITTYTPVSSERNNQIKLFGYDLGIEYHAHIEERFVQPDKRVIFYLHPWGLTGMPNKKHAHLLKHYDVLPGNVITFNFPDGLVRTPIPVWHTSFGQLSDVLPALYALNYAYETFGLEAVDLFGYSRGGAVAVNMLAVLNDKSDQYDEFLLKIGITRQRRKRLISLVEKGSLVLNCPLIDGNVTLQSYSRPIQFLARTFTNYREDGLQALDSVASLSDLKLTVLLHFQYNDTWVTNQKEAEFYNAFAQINPDSVYLLLGNDGGHSHTQTTISKAIHAFYKESGAAYDRKQLKEYELAPKQKNQLRGRLLQPTLTESQKIIAAFHAAGPDAQ